MLTPFFFGGMPSRCYYFATIWGDFHKEPRPMPARLTPPSTVFSYSALTGATPHSIPQRPSAPPPSGLGNSFGAITSTHKTTPGTVTDMPMFRRFPTPKTHCSTTSASHCLPLQRHATPPTSNSTLRTWSTRSGLHPQQVAHQLVDRSGERLHRRH